MVYSKLVKRGFDLFASTIAIAILSPLFILVAIAIKMDSKGPVFFTQDRVGKDGKLFRIIKFRSMLTFEESYLADGTPMSNYDRITRVGRFLRKTSLDELPQLFNVLKGDMSIVGPRPTLPYQVEKYNATQRQRLAVRPGLTGLAQINGRNELTWEEKIQYDLKYIQSLSFLNDLQIIFKTVFVVLRGEKVEFSKHDDISKHSGDVLEDVR
jgi:exopolysaccharide biosynthesis polyprenyl glycosylphosphotransferase